MSFTIYQHIGTWNILPYVEIDLPSKERGWRLTTGWLCYSLEIEKCNG